MFPEDFPSDLPLVLLRMLINTSKPQQSPFPYLPFSWRRLADVSKLCDTVFLKNLHFRSAPQRDKGKQAPP